MSILDDLKKNADEIAEGYNEYRALVQGLLRTVNIPKGSIYIGDYAFNGTNIEKVIMPSSVAQIGRRKYYGGSFRGCAELKDVIFSENLKLIFPESFAYCSSLKKIVIPQSVKSISAWAFRDCSRLEEISLPDGLEKLGVDDGTSSGRVFYNCRNLRKVNIPNAIVYTQNLFHGCSSLEDVTIANGFNNDGLNLSYSTLYSSETIVSWLNALADRTGQTAYTLTIGSTNLAKLTPEQIAIATNKNWNLA